ncbi:c-type cytochrome [Aestuariirhabdus sp. Z084]|uniref:c-type cytochrome n=1 Tax=Aestuariirhabdus haliotis TaxID=2918751 RepID=UPI00201B3F6D|nr:c-type cytochrome [Aestuariirhabdus haliotis]MCL6415867.1 c-type cytochrome [Aestuariirhabdus haliotis]MCL6419831.1 c-type cytochrome [Aestuariirhabdus haliotis]
MKKVIASAAALLLSASVFAADGKAVYEKACKVCHAAGVAGAPKANDAAAWEPRLALGMDALLASVKNGKNAMPAGAMCADCSDDDYKAAIEYMSK